MQTIFKVFRVDQYFSFMIISAHRICLYQTSRQQDPQCRGLDRLKCTSLPRHKGRVASADWTVWGTDDLYLVIYVHKEFLCVFKGGSMYTRGLSQAVVE